jgi:hypothetical protein
MTIDKRWGRRLGLRFGWVMLTGLQAENGWAARK